MKKLVVEWLEKAGIQVNGSAPWDIQVHNERLYKRFFLLGTLGAGESYMDGDWDCEALDELSKRLFSSHLLDNVCPRELPALWLQLKAFFSNMGKRSKAFQVGQQHYDIGNNLDVCSIVTGGRPLKTLKYFAE